MLNKTLLTLLAACTLTNTVHAGFNPTLSLTGNYTWAYQRSEIRTGTFEIQNRKVNVGFEFTNRFYLNDDNFISTGIRYSPYRNIIYGTNQVTTVFDKPRPFTWEKKYAGLTVPVHFGREFTAGKGRKGSMYAGASAGILTTNYAKTMVSGGLPKNVNNRDTVSAEIFDPNNQTPTYFLSTLDIGASYQPFKAARRFSIGIQGSVQLNNTKPYVYTGTVRSQPSGAEYKYDITHHQKHINGSVLLSYTFGKYQPADHKRN